MRKFIFLTVSMLVVAGGCWNNSKNPPAEPNTTATTLAKDELALAVGGETLTSKELIGSLVEQNGKFVPLIERFRTISRTTKLENFKKLARPELEKILTTKVSHILLNLHAQRKLEGIQIDQQLEQLVDSKVRDFIANNFRGDPAAAQSYLKQNGMDWDSYRESQQKMIINQWYIATQLPPPGPVTHDELVDRYNKEKEQFALPPAIKFQLIDIETAKLNLPDPNQSRLERARKLAEKLATQIKTYPNLSEVAKDYPGVSFVAFSKPVNPDSLAQPYDILAAEAQKIEPGQTAGPIESEAKEHIFLMKLDYKRPKSYKPLAQVQRQLRRKISAERRKQAFQKVEAEFTRQAALCINDKFVDFCLEKIYRMSKQ